MHGLEQFRPLILMLSGFMGACGVVLAAAASHGGDAHLLGSASTMCLAHAPVLLGLYLANGQIRTATLSGLVLAFGTLLFATDLVMRHFGHAGLFPMAAPAGGIGMIAGWLLLAAGAFWRTPSA
ncbi:uncharacterized membrane protein YgdD (TMEM256/DUF423 family) [Neorhizobium galegae]|uniref:DUF423 domain-containing protein n=1 Tax=Neorhizobium galegae TaxID=399 RepID=UPI001AE2B052|nr:DUF423 domain-containing protein [Neorhizobium galegae]MBP2550516.1 uncharacterized membrane protein YgdD (TMEM256/DUF423 family) [Neorhizobium galegae]